MHPSSGASLPAEMTAHRRITQGACAALLALALGCRTTEEYRDSADKQVYSILSDLRATYVADPGAFTIDHPGLPELGEEPVELVECLNIAARGSRDYEARKERLYLAALDLTFERYLFNVRGTGGFGGDVARTGPGMTPAEVSGTGSLTKLLGSGAAIVGDMGLRLFKDLSTGDGVDAVLDLGLSLTMPLMRGSGKRIVEERLTQAERDVVYEVRSYERFRRTFSVDVAGRVFRILQQADRVTNEEINIQNLRVLRQRNEELADAGRLSDIQVDQALQDELRSSNRLIVEEQTYQGLLDGLKQFLGVPVEDAFEPDPIELERLAAGVPDTVLPDEEFLAEIALRERLDYQTALDRVDDAGRKVYVAEDALRAGLALVSQADITSASGQPLDFDSDDLTWSLGLDLDLPVDRLVERNNYRTSLITLQAAERDLDRLGDNIRGQLRAALRQAAATVETNEIQRGAVELAERRVESARLRLAAGRADTRDILEAQEDLLEAKNAATRSLIDHHLALLALWRDVELLRVDEAGISVAETLFEPGELQP